MTFRQTISYWNRGVILDNWAADELFRGLNWKTWNKFKQQVPPQLMELLRERAAYLPTTDEGWSQMRTLEMGSWTGVEIDREGRQQQELRLLRMGVEIFRERFSD